MWNQHICLLKIKMKFCWSKTQEAQKLTFGRISVMWIFYIIPDFQICINYNVILKFFVFNFGICWFYYGYVVRVIKSTRLKWAYLVARMEENRSAFKILTGTPAGNPPRWSSGQRVWLLIMRSRVRSPALPQILNVD